MRIYLTHCTGIKRDDLKNTGEQVHPEELYLSVPFQRFVRTCQENNVTWAVFSDLYGIWFPQQTRPWYDKHPDTVTSDELNKLIRNFDTDLKDFSEIWFYNNPSWFHKLYQMVLTKSSLSARITTFSKLKEIV